MAERRVFSVYEKRTIYAKHNGTCAICGRPVKFKKMTVDHIVPLSKGGTNEMSNLRLACCSCNRIKSDVDDDEFYRKIFGILWYHKKDVVKCIFTKEKTIYG